MNTIKYFLLSASVLLSAHVFAQSKLEVVAEFPSERPGNIAVSPEGRIFITMSALVSSKHMVREILSDGSTVPFPEEEWVMQPNSSNKGVSGTIGIQVSSDNMLWVLDMGNPGAALKQNPKLIGWNIATRKLFKVFIIPDTVLTATSFLQDFIIDMKNGTAVIADMTSSIGGQINPALIIVNLNTGFAKRVLQDHPSFLPISDPIIVDGIKVIHKKADGTAMQPRNGLNPISIDKENNFIYFGAMGAKKIYKIPSSVLADESLSNESLAKYISFYADKPISDGFKVGENGNIYVTDVQENAVGVSSPQGYKKLLADKRLSWPDGVALYKGYLYIVANQLHHLPLLNNGVDASRPPYYVFRMKID
ncbi:L-dopachrome tautomerase-related protein [Flavobacterium sp. DG2-3]|uniref:L-dopachrome tautomerase-related protein n=1 Tax=Flavobacterium sp. DG2-3 TaxID=3068317 RepID=UPI00273FFC8D|nr:L-dopachrome tautomerase-related protein [Flavobacterium sp. DG2-3]MDP5200301.1 L-dopachrome tautomerase-related protein [Flavobacterium sp. DG2-3]